MEIYLFDAFPRPCGFVARRGDPNDGVLPLFVRLQLEHDVPDVSQQLDLLAASVLQAAILGEREGSPTAAPQFVHLWGPQAAVKVKYESMGQRL